MSPVTRPSKALPLVVLATGIAVSLSGCIMPPSLPTAPPQAPTASPQPTAIADPIETTTAPTPPSADGELPELVAIGTELPPGMVGGWETSILTDDAFTIEADSTFPEGPMISVVETATGCSFWAYQGDQDSDSTDEGESSEVTLGILSGSSPDDWEADIFTLDASSQGSSVEMLSIFEEPEDGSVQAWYARNFQSGEMTSSIRAECPAGTGDLEHVDAVVGEHFQINFLVP
jgi:hypothetical protein